MILRMWKGNVRSENFERFKDQFENHDLPILRSQRGCTAAFLSRDYYDRDGTFVIITLWENLDSLIAFTGKDWKKPVTENSEVRVVEGASQVEHFAISPYEKGEID
jgi:heme-degrading monooxygenase HmoA